MRAVIDTNVLVSALLTPAGVAAQLLVAIRAVALVPVVSHEILAEYVEVLNRTKFRFAKASVEDLLDDMRALAVFVMPDPLPIERLPDLSDAPFIAAAKAVACPVVTGNAKHFPARLGLHVLSPAQCLQLLSTPSP